MDSLIDLKQVEVVEPEPEEKPLPKPRPKKDYSKKGQQGSYQTSFKELILETSLNLKFDPKLAEQIATAIKTRSRLSGDPLGDLDFEIIAYKHVFDWNSRGVKQYDAIILFWQQERAIYYSPSADIPTVGCLIFFHEIRASCITWYADKYTFRSVEDFTKMAELLRGGEK